MTGEVGGGGGSRGWRLEAGERREETVGLTLDTWSQFGSLKAGVMSAASLPCHYLSLHALISAPVGPQDTYNDGSAKRRPGASGRSPGAIGGGESRHNKGGTSTQPSRTLRCKAHRENRGCMWCKHANPLQVPLARGPAGHSGPLWGLRR